MIGYGGGGTEIGDNDCVELGEKLMESAIKVLMS